MTKCAFFKNMNLKIMGKIEKLYRRVEEREKAINKTLTTFMGMYTLKKLNIY